MRPHVTRRSWATLVTGLVVLVLITTSPAHAVDPVAVESDGESVPVAHSGDALDDPAVWVHPTDPSQSLVMGNDKQGGFEAYDLDGELVQRLTSPEGFWGNVDVRQGVRVSGVQRDVVAVVRGGIRMYTVDVATRQLIPVTDGAGAVPTSGEGLCLYHSSADQRLYAVVITRAGRLRQYEIFDGENDGLLEGRLVRDFEVGSESEGCVADDDAGQLYVSQEDVALWRYGAEPEDGTSRVAVDRVDTAGGNLTPDIEGVTLAELGDSGYLIVSAQNVATPWRSYFNVYRRQPPNGYVGSFRVEDSATADDCDRTDGVAAYAGDLGPDFPEGIFVCQDNNNVPPGGSGNQSFKYVRLEKLLALTGGNVPPTAVIEHSCEATSCSFAGEQSSDADGSVVAHEWDFGDGATATGVQASHTYAADGVYTVTLTVTDDAGATDTATAEVVVQSETGGAVEFVAQDSVNVNARRFTVTVPAQVAPGDAMLLFLGTNRSDVQVDGPPGWTQVDEVVDGTSTTTVWQRVATGDEAGTEVTLTTAGAYTKAALTVVAYRGTASSPVDAAAAAGVPGSTTTHTTPTVNGPAAGRLAVSYWMVKSGAVTTLTPPEGEVVRSATTGSGGGAITTLLTDAGEPGASASYGGVTATADGAADKGGMFTIVLRSE